MGKNINPRILLAELIGTAVLMLGGPGVAILAGDKVGVLGISLGFGFSLLIMAYAIGPISGCHINPAVTLGLLVSKKIDNAHAAAAWIGQVFGGLGGGAAIYVLAKPDMYSTRQFASNLWTGEYFGIGATVIAEVALTAVLVFVVLATTKKDFPAGMGPIAAGLTLTLIHLISIPIDNTSVNPARSLGAATFAADYTDALQQLWVFIVFPLLGALLGAGAHMLLNSDES
ncbi:MAG: hypothetical protein RLZ04_920 [Actinomycetota bacterium]|jgi:aquaporin Z